MHVQVAEVRKRHVLGCLASLLAGEEQYAHLAALVHHLKFPVQVEDSMKRIKRVARHQLFLFLLAHGSSSPLLQTQSHNIELDLAHEWCEQLAEMFDRRLRV